MRILLIVMVAILSTATIAANHESDGCNIATGGCRVSSQNLVDWERKPEIIDGYLYMSGRTKDNTPIHNPLTARSGTNWPAFGLNNFEETTDEYRLVSVGRIWPQAMRGRLSSTSTPNIVAEEYEVTGTSFKIRAKIPESLLRPNIRLVVAVWGSNPNPSQKAIGAACVE